MTVWKKRVDENGVARYAAEENWKLFDECEKKQKAEKEQQRRNRETASSSAAASSLSSLSSRTESDDLVLGHHAATHANGSDKLDKAFIEEMQAQFGSECDDSKAAAKTSAKGAAQAQSKAGEKPLHTLFDDL